MDITNINISDIFNLKIGECVPDFCSTSTFGNFKMSDYIGKWVVFFSHPGDFTPVCTTEFIAFAKYFSEFSKRNCSLLGLSIDSTPSHLAWVHNIYRCTGIKIPFPIISDRDMKISKMFNMLDAMNTSQNIRSVYIIDPEQKIRAILQYPITVGRNISEILRIVDALQIVDQEKVVTPANWIPGSSTVEMAPKTYDELLEREKFKTNNCLDWYLCYSQDNNLNSSNMTNSIFGIPDVIYSNDTCCNILTNSNNSINEVT